MRERKDAYRALVRILEGTNHWEEPDVDRRIILKWIFERLGGGRRLD
jgi:hypothetical protein